MSEGQPHFMDVERALEALKKVEYLVKPKDGHALGTDQEPWNPRRIVTDAIGRHPNEVEVELIDESVSLNNVNKELHEQKTVGLVVMGPVIGRGTKPLLILMVTSRKIYAIEPDDLNRGVAFVKIKLKDQELSFWTTNGLDEADCLYHNYGIDLSESRATCCSGVHVHLMQVMRYSTNAANALYPVYAAVKSRRGVRIESFWNLVEIWLDINFHEINYDISQLQHLKSRPLNLTATNLIKKRCLLVLPLAQTLDRYALLESSLMSRNTMRRLVCRDDATVRDILRMLDKLKKKGEFDVGYISHLQDGSTSLKETL